MGIHELGILVGVLFSLLVAVLSWISKSMIEETKKKLEELDVKVSKIDNRMITIEANIQATYGRVIETIETTKSLGNDFKAVFRLETELKIIQDRIAMIPKMKEDIDQAHRMIRELR